MIDRKVYILFTVVFLLAACAFAQDVQFTAGVSKNPVAADERFTLEYTVTTTGASAKNFRTPDLGKFLVLSGPNQSTSMQIINGSVSSSQIFSYILQPREPGKISIAPASVEVGGNQYSSNAVDLTVTKSSGRAAQQQSQQQEQSVEVGDNLFLRAEVDRTRLYQGEQITVTYKVYTRVRIANYGINKLPTMTGFWGEDLEVPQQVNMTNEVIDGKQYQVGILKKMALFPTQSGNLEINPMELTCQVQLQQRRKSNDIFDQFFNDPFFGSAQTANVTIKNEPVKITVLPLPRNNIPESFNGAVGKFSLKGELNKRTIKTNEPISLKATVSGTGNVKILEAPKLNLPSDFEQYEPKITESIQRSAGVISGTKTFEWLIVPRYPGEKKIPALEFTYFDISQRRYITLRTNEFNVLVEKGSAEAQNYATGLTKADVKLLNQDIRFIKTVPGSFRKKNEELIDPTVAIVMTVVPLLGFIGLLIYRQKEISSMSDIVSFRSRRAMKIAAKKLQYARSLLQTDATDAFYAEISNALWQYVSDKLSLDRSELSVENVTQNLREKNVSEDLTVRIQECLEASEFSRFAPGGALQDEKNKMYENASSIIVAAERELVQ